MRFYKKIIYVTALLMLMMSLFSFAAAADAGDAAGLIADSQGGLVCVSHRGDVQNYPAGSLEAIRGATEKGADAVSVPVTKTADGVFVLVEDISLGNVCNTDKASVSDITFEELEKCFLYDSFGELTVYKAVTLEKALAELGDEVYLILDISWEDRDGIYKLLEECDAFSRVSLRTDASAKKIAEWSDGRADVIGIYKSNIIWSSISHINKLSEAGMMMAEYRTKNYFNVCYDKWVGNNFSADGKARAVAACYDTELCGKRADSDDGWGELIDKGFTVIETNNIEALVSYSQRLEQSRSRLAQLVEKTKNTDFSAYSQLSRANITQSLESAEAVLSGRVKSLQATDGAYSALTVSLADKRVADGAEETKGALNITGGKLVAVLAVGAVFIASQIFVYKMHKKNKT